MTTRAKAHAILSATLSLPLLAAPMAGESAMSNSNTPDRLTDNQLDAVTSGRHPIECLCGMETPPDNWGNIKDRLADHIPKWQPKPNDPPMVTTYVVGEEGGGISPVFWKF